ncbi:MAG: class I SAM-dependent methyltransferase [Candidatus Aramenus sp.]|nr:class I SAM-dependent methyltransferase [Candidatus Aramenus sp.]
MSEILDMFACPIDGTKIDANLTCEKGHRFSYIDGIYDFLGKEVKTHDVLEKVTPIYENVWAPLGFLITAGRTYSSIMEEAGNYVSGKVVLDVGTGTGKLFDYAGCERCVGLDISTKFLRVMLSKRSKVIAVKGDARKLPFKAEVFDGVASLFVLHMLDNPSLAVHEISRVMKREARCVIGILTSGNFIASILGKWWKISLKHRDFYLSSIKEAGLELEDSKRMGPWLLLKCKKSGHF